MDAVVTQIGFNLDKDNFLLLLLIKKILGLVFAKENLKFKIILIARFERHNVFKLIKKNT